MNPNCASEPKRAFISHSSQDDSYVAELVSLLRAMGYSEVFNDSHTIEPGEDFWQRIEDGIMHCDTFVIVITAASNESSWVDREVELALRLNKKVLPIWTEDCDLPATLADRDVIDFRPGKRIIDRKIAPSRILRHAPAILFGRESWLEALDAAWADPHLNLYTLVAWGGVGKTSLVAHWVAERLMKRGWPGVKCYFDWSFYDQGTGESRQTSADPFIHEALLFFGDPDPTLGGPWERGERLARLVRQNRTLLVLDGIEPLQYPPNDRSGMAGRLKDPGLEALVQGLAADNPGLCLITTREHLTNVESLKTIEEKKLDQLPKEAAIALLQYLQIVGTDEELEAAWKDAGGHALTLQLLGRFIADAYTDRDIRHYKDVHFVEAEDHRSMGRSAFKVMIAYEKWLASAGPARQRELALLRLTGLFDRPISDDCLKALRAEPAIPGLTDSLVKLKETVWNITLQRLIDIDLVSRSGSGKDLAIDAHPLVREYFAEQLQLQPYEVATRKAHERLYKNLEQSSVREPKTHDEMLPWFQAVAHACKAHEHWAAIAITWDRILRKDEYYSTNRLGLLTLTLGTASEFFSEPWTVPIKTLHGRPGRQMAMTGELLLLDLGWLCDFIRSKFPRVLQAGAGSLLSIFRKPLTLAEERWRRELLTGTGVLLSGLGRHLDAVGPMQLGLNEGKEHKDWLTVARNARNLCQTFVLLGRLKDALEIAREYVEIADDMPRNVRNRERHRIISRTSVGLVLHQLGREDDARKAFVEAEEIQMGQTVDSRQLNSLWGFRYWQLLIDEEKYEEVIQRSDKAIPLSDEPEQIEGFVGLNKSFCLLASGRAKLCQQAPKGDREFRDVAQKYKEALGIIRRTQHRWFFPVAFLALVELDRMQGKFAEAESWLDQAERIALQDKMRLVQIDCLLERARLYLGRNHCSPSGASEEVRRSIIACGALIIETGYLRRSGELNTIEDQLGIRRTESNVL
jgi:tetratricopeptide (TPR) repeat protein